MTDKHMKKCATSLIIRGMKIKTMRYPQHPLGWLLSKTNRKQVLVRTWRNWNSCELLVEMQNCKIVQLLCKIVYFSSKKNRYIIIIWPSNSTLGYRPKRIESDILKWFLCTYVHSSIFTISKMWKQPKSSMDK